VLLFIELDMRKVDVIGVTASPRQLVTKLRDPGSPFWRPVYQDGRHFRFAVLLLFAE
jgi:hypothetical protein